MTSEPAIRRGNSEDLVDVMRLFDGALLETDSDRIGRQLAGTEGCVLLACVDDRPVGAVALLTEGTKTEIPIATTSRHEPVHITAIAVRNARQNQGFGRALINGAADHASPRPLTATFDKRVLPFYRACGFEITHEESRLCGVRPASVD